MTVSATQARPQVVTFDTEIARYLVTRKERFRLAILHGLPDAKAAELAHGPEGIGIYRYDYCMSADWLADHFDADGKVIAEPVYESRLRAQTLMNRKRGYP